MGQDEIDPALMRKLERLGMKQIVPRPATSNPQIDRSINQLDKLGYRDEINKSNIQPMPMFDFKSGSNTLGDTDMENNIRLNPHALALYPDLKNTATLAHELTHVRQNLRDGPSRLANLDVESMRPYEERPSEAEAFAAGDKYQAGLAPDNRQQQYANFGRTPKSYFDALPRFIPFDGYKK